MICKKCGKENITKANYCKHCGTAFTVQEQQTAYDATIYGKIDKASGSWNKIKSTFNLSFITDNKFFKYGLLAVILVYGLLAGGNQGNKMIVMASDEYKVQQDVNTDAFYLLTSQESVNLQLYVPGVVETLSIEMYDTDDRFLSGLSFNPEEPIVLYKNNDAKYNITAISPEGENQQIVVYVTE